MAKYIVQLRRGIKEKAADGTITRDDWETYTQKKPTEAIPREGELVLEYDNGIPRLKIGNGIDPFSALPYLSVDSFILPKQVATTIYADKWIMTDDNYNLIDEYGNLINEEGNITEESYYSVDEAGNFVDENGNVVKIRYAQRVEITNVTITANSKVDLNPTQEMLAVFHEKDLAFVAENDGGAVWVYCVGQKPANDYTIQTTVTEVTANG